jgi:molybdenum cofactor biosynthesis enzyme MoaA
MTLRFRIDKTVIAGSSVTQRHCNLACVWCHHDYFSHHGFTAIGNDEYRWALNRVIEAAAPDRAEVRIAGDGEPTLTGDELPDLVAKCKAIPRVAKVALTTNGILLGHMVAALKAAGLDGVTVSLNSLTRSGYQRYSQHDSLEHVLLSIRLAHAAGLRMKINLAYTLWNQDEIPAFEELSCQHGGMPIKVFDLIPTGDTGDLFAPLSRLEAQLKLKAETVAEQRHPYAKRVYSLRSGAVFEVKIAGRNNTCPMLACPARAICLEGCRHSARIGLDGWMHPCGVRTDNKINLFAPATTGEDICRALASGGKLRQQAPQPSQARHWEPAGRGA